MTRRPSPRSRLLRVLLALVVILLGPGVTGAALAAGPPAAAGASPATAVAAGDVNFSIERLAGSDRYVTAARISQRFFAPGVPVAFVVTGQNFPDGLAAGPAGDQLGGPVLFVRTDSLPGATKTELQRLRPGRIYVLGGTSTISESVRLELAALSTGGAVRIAGADRYATSALVSQRAFPSGASVAYVATGVDWPDALSGGAAAGVQSAPVLLTQPANLPSTVRAELTRLDPDRIMLLGSTASVSAGVAAELAGIATVERVGGTDRYQTALLLSQRVFGPDRPGVVVTSGQAYADALAAGPATRTTRGPILLSRSTALPGGTTAEAARLSPTTAYLLGGTDRVPVVAAKDLQRTLGVCWSGPTYAAGTPEVISRVSGTTSPKVSFTLDMGGRLDGGLGIVDYLIDHQVCTTFFPTSIMASTTEGRAIMARIAANPHLFEVGNHTVHHCDLVNGGGGSPTSAPCQVPMTATFIRAELTDAQIVLRALTGMQITPYWRPPYGSYNSFVLEQAAAVGYTKTIYWNRDTIDWDPATTTSQIVARATSPLPLSGSIILAHLGGYNTPAALPQIVSILRANGYTMTTLSDMRDG